MSGIGSALVAPPGELDIEYGQKPVSGDEVAQT